MMINFEKSPQRKESVLTSIKFTNLGLLMIKTKENPKNCECLKRRFINNVFKHIFSSG